MTSMRFLPRDQLRQQGAALLLAMLTVTLIASFAAAALWQQWRSTEIEINERARIQSAWLLIGALDWSRLILREDGLADSTDHLAEPWAIPLQEARLSTFLAENTDQAAINDNSTDTQDAFLSGYMLDAQARINLFNLSKTGEISTATQTALQKLYALLGLPSEELEDLVANLQAAVDPDRQNAPLLPQKIGQLTWLGVSNSSLTTLAPFVNWLPESTPINLNTARAEVLYACIPALDMASAQRIVQQRENSPFKSANDARQRINIPANIWSDQKYSIESDYFEVYGRLRLEKITVEEHSLVQRHNRNVVTLWRERGALNINTAHPRI